MLEIIFNGQTLLILHNAITIPMIMPRHTAMAVILIVIVEPSHKRGITVQKWYQKSLILFTHSLFHAKSFIIILHPTGFWQQIPVRKIKKVARYLTVHFVSRDAYSFSLIYSFSDFYFVWIIQQMKNILRIIHHKCRCLSHSASRHSVYPAIRCYPSALR